MRLFITTTIFLFLMMASCFAQKISGEWEGYLDQSVEASKMASYKTYWEKGLWAKGQKTHDLTLTFRYDSKKKQYTGEYYINESLNDAHYARFFFNATFQNNKARYTTTEKIFETKNTLNLGFCFSEATLNYTEDSRYEYLEGEWRGWNDDSRACAGAHVWVRRRKYYSEEPAPEPVVVEKKDTIKKVEIVVIEKIDTIVEMNIPIVETIEDTVVKENSIAEYKSRKLVTKESMHVKKDSLEIQIWDSNREDGDIISLEFNGQLILQEHTLTNAKKTLKIYLQKGENILTLVAHNLGEIPPNTAAISIERTEGRKEIILESDMGKSESIKIVKE